MDINNIIEDSEALTTVDESEGDEVTTFEQPEGLEIINVDITEDQDLIGGDGDDTIEAGSGNDQQFSF